MSSHHLPLVNIPHTNASQVSVNSAQGTATTAATPTQGLPMDFEPVTNNTVGSTIHRSNSTCYSRVPSHQASTRRSQPASYGAFPDAFAASHRPVAEQQPPYIPSHQSYHRHPNSNVVLPASFQQAQPDFFNQQDNNNTVVEGIPLDLLQRREVLAANLRRQAVFDVAMSNEDEEQDARIQAAIDSLRQQRYGWLNYPFVEEDDLHHDNEQDDAQAAAHRLQQLIPRFTLGDVVLVVILTATIYLATHLLDHALFLSYQQGAMSTFTAATSSSPTAGASSSELSFLGHWGFVRTVLRSFWLEVVAVKLPFVV